MARNPRKHSAGVSVPVLCAVLHARTRARPLARLTVDTVGRYSAPPKSHAGDGGVAFTDSAGRRCQSDTHWIVFLQFAWKVTQWREFP